MFRWYHNLIIIAKFVLLLLQSGPQCGSAASLAASSVPWCWPGRVVVPPLAARRGVAARRASRRQPVRGRGRRCHCARPPPGDDPRHLGGVLSQCGHASPIKGARRRLSLARNAGGAGWASRWSSAPSWCSGWCHGGSLHAAHGVAEQTQI